MKISLHSKGLITSKKIIIPAIVAVIAAGALLGTTLTNSKPAGATDSPLVDQVQQQQDELNNHESRISNAENNITGLQTGTTPTAPSTSSTTTTATTNPPAPTTTPSTSQVVTVTSYLQIPLDGNGNIDCKFTYSDGTTYQWHWQTVNPQGSWMTDGQGQNGHWVSTTQTDGTCNSSVVGGLKSN